MVGPKAPVRSIRRGSVVVESGIVPTPVNGKTGVPTAETATQRLANTTSRLLAARETLEKTELRLRGPSPVPEGDSPPYGPDDQHLGAAIGDVERISHELLQLAVTIAEFVG